MLILAGSVIAACGGSSKSPSTTSGTTSTGAHTTPNNKRAAGRPLQQLVVNAKGAQPSSSVKVGAGQVVAIVTTVPDADVGKKVNIELTQTTPTTFTATSTVLGTSLKATGQITTSTPGLQISNMQWGCRYPLSFCPLNVLSSSTTHVKLAVKSSNIPVTVTALFNRPGAVPATRLAPLGLPAPGTSVQATTMALVASKSKSVRPVPSTSVTASPGSVIVVTVQPAPNTAAHATLRIAIPNTSGSSIAVEGGGTQSQPSSTATIHSSSGSMRVTGLAWRCSLPPATFCPFSSIKTTATGLAISLPAPQVPVQLTLLTDKA